MKDKLIEFLKTNGKAGSWREIYDKFPFKGLHLTNKQKGDAVRKLYNSSIIQTLEVKSPKILVFDIETAPLRAYVWRLWKQNIHPTNGQLQSEYFILTWSAKWLFNKEVLSEKLTSDEVLKEDDSRLVESMWKLFDEADIVIAHYALGFDVKVLNTRFFKLGLHLPSPYQVIDTKYHASKQFLLESNKLDYIGKVLGLGRKIDTGGFELWENCMKGDVQALEEMRLYNIQDVLLLEEIYLALRPYIKPHPNLNLIIENDVIACPTCMSTDLKWSGSYKAQTNSYDAFQCKSCGSQGRSRKSNLSKTVKLNLTKSI